MMKLFKSETTPAAASYNGKAQQAVFNFSTGPEQFDFINKFFVNSYVQECEKAINQKSPGDQLLTMELWRDVSPFLETNYMCVITSTDVTGNPLPWLLIIGVALAAIIVWLIVRPLLQSVTDLIWGRPNAEGKTPVPWTILAIGGVAALWLLTGKGTGETKVIPERVPPPGETKQLIAN
jgi:hypothetical protein